MSYTLEDAEREEGYERLYNELGPQWFDEHEDELYRQHYEQAVKEFTAERLQSYYVAHPDLAEPAHRALAYAQSLSATHPQAALVFATTAVELTIKVVLLQPIVHGLVHVDNFAPMIAELCLQQTGAKRFHVLLFEILSQYGGVNLREFKRPGSEKTLWQEFITIQDSRNSVTHAFKSVDTAVCDLAIEIASTLLKSIFPQVLTKLDLHLHDPGVVCQKKHTVGFAVYFPLPGHVPSISATVELNIEQADLDNMPEIIRGVVVAGCSADDLLALHSPPTVPMWITSTLIQYEVRFAANSTEFTGTKTSDYPAKR